MNLIIEISNIKNCIEQLRTLARQYESYTDVFAPSNFSVPSGTPLSRKLTDVRNNYRGIQINLQLVAQFLEYYVSDLENLENKMGNLGAVASFHSNLSLGSISETSGLVEKPYSFPKTRIFDGASNVTFADSQLTGEAVTYNLPLASAMQFSVIDEKELNKKMLELIIKDQSYGLPLANPESVFLSKGEQKVLASIYAHQYDESISSQEKEIDRTQKEIDRLEDITKPIEKELVGYGYSLESYRREKGSAYSQAFLEAKTLVDDYRNNPASASKIGLTSAQMSKMSDDALARIIVQKDSSVGLNYQNLLKIGDKVGYTLEFEKKLQAAYKENNDAVFAKNHLEQEKAAIPYQLLRKSKEFNEFTYEVPKASVEVKRTGENNYYVEYPKNSSVDEYAFLKSYKEKNVTANLRGISDSDAYLNMISLSDEFPELEKEYYYILKSQGKEAARDYVLNMEGTVNQLVGEREAAKRLATLSQDPNKVNQEIYNLFGTAVYGYGDGVVSNLESISHIFDEKRCYSASEYTKMYFASAIVSQDEKLNGKYLVKDDRGHVKSTSTVIDYSIDYGKYLDIPYNTMQAVGNMTPSMLVGSALGPFGNTAARIGSSVMLGLGSYGSKYHQTMVEGYSKGQAVAAGLASATLEVGSEAALGGLPIFDDTPVVDVFGYAFKGGKEGLQEGVQSVNDLFIDSLILGKDVKMTWKDTQNEMMYGALSALVLGVPGFYSGAKNYNLNRNNLYLLGQDYNTGAISLDEARTLTESLLGYEKISDNDAKYLLKMNKQNVSTLTQSASGSINPAFLQLLNHYHVANSLSVQQQELLNSTPGLQEVLQNKAQNQEAFVPDSLKEAYDQYQSLEEKLNKVDKVARDSAKEFTLREDSLEGIRSRMEELKNNPELQAVIKNHDSGETTYVPSELSDNFNEYLNLKNQERHLVQQLDEIKNKVHVDLGHRVHSLASSVANSVASSVTQAYEASAVVGIVPPVIRDIMNVFGGINSDTSPFHIDKKKYPKVIRQYMNDIMQDLNVSAQTGHVFESLFEDDEYVYGIHQAGRNKGETILKDGLRLTGHSGKNGVSVSESVNLTENVSFHKSGIEAMPWAFRSILSADSYNDAMGTGDAVIFAFPKSMFLDLDTGDYDVKPGVNYYTVDKDTQMKYLDPKYIVGYVTNDHGKVSNFNFNPSYLNSSFLEKNGFRTQVSQNNTTDGEIDNRYNQQMTLESLQNKVEFQTSFLNKFNSDVEQLCQENEEFRAYLQNPTNDNISIELQQSIDKYNQLRESYSLSQSFVIDDYLSNQEDIRKLLAGRAISELNTTEYNQYKGLLRKQNWCFFQSSSVAEQLQFINDCTYFAQEGDIINNIESFDKRVQDEIVKKLLKEQTGILARNAIDYDTYEAKMFLTEHLEFISDISSQNLAYLYKVSDNKAAVLNEVLNRVRKGDLVLDSAFDLVSMGPGLTINPSQLLWDDIVTNRPDITSEVVDLYNSMKTPLYNKLFAEIGDNLSELQRLSLASLIYHNHITEKNVSLILKALSQPGIVPNINIGIYQDDIIQDLGIDFVNSVARFPSITSTILSLKEQSESAYYYFVNIVKGSSGRSLNAQEELVMNALTYLSEHSSVDYSKINLDDFEQFLFVSSAHPELNLKYTDNFSYDFKQVYMNQLFATNSLEEGKNAYFMAKYSMSLDEVQDFLHTYGTDI
ncbi:MAG: hypothetical protein IJ743_04295, partial [Bacilli bacterium]|nr:hypothetical protein [Bacilli bacterium]